MNQSTLSTVVGNDVMVFGLVFSFGMLVFWGVLQILGSGWDRYRQAFSERAKVNLEQMFVFVDIGQLFTLNIIAVALCGVMAWLLTGNPVIGSVVGAAVAIMPRHVLRIIRNRRINALRNQLPDATMLIAGALRAGSALPAALTQMVSEMPAPTSQEFDLFLREQRMGVELELALDHLERRVPVEEYSLFCAALKIARETGGNLAETLEQLADTLRQKATIEGKIRALTAQGKLQGLIVGMLPVAIAFFLFKLEPKAMHPLFTTWYGWSVVGFVAIMELLGGLIIKKIVTIDI